jgi:hypothetical protein
MASFVAAHSAGIAAASVVVARLSFCAVTAIGFSAALAAVATLAVILGLCRASGQQRQYQQAKFHAFHSMLLAGLVYRRRTTIPPAA